MAFKVIHTIIDLIFPAACVGCHAPETHLCEPCALSMRTLSNECFFCATQTSKNHICENCKKSSPIEAIWWPWRYQNEKTKNAIASFKYRKRAWLAGTFGPHLTSAIDTEMLPHGTITIPVPLFPARKRERGFNQAEKLAGELPFPVLVGAAIRIQNTESQARTHSRRERYEHMQNAFRVVDPKAIAGKTILLVDDVATTGATLTELARTLKKAGAAKIYAAVLAHG